MRVTLLRAASLSRPRFGPVPRWELCHPNSKTIYILYSLTCNVIFTLVRDDTFDLNIHSIFV